VHGEEHTAPGKGETLQVVVGQTPPPVMQLDLQVVQGAVRGPQLEQQAVR